MLDLLAQSSAVLSIGAGDEQVQAYFMNSVADLRKRHDRVRLIDCREVIQ
jgi:hypothetical protein